MVCSLVSIKHKRKDGYWLYYHLAHTVERDTVIGNIVYLVKENPPPCSKNVSSSSRRGRKPVHSWEKLVCICILMVVFGLTYRDMQNAVPSLNLPWNNDEPYPDHTWIARTFKKIPLKYLEDILTIPFSKSLMTKYGVYGFNDYNNCKHSYANWYMWK